MSGVDFTIGIDPFMRTGLAIFRRPAYKDFMSFQLHGYPQFYLAICNLNRNHKFSHTLVDELYERTLRDCFALWTDANVSDKKKEAKLNKALTSYKKDPRVTQIWVDRIFENLEDPEELIGDRFREHRGGSASGAQENEEEEDTSVQQMNDAQPHAEEDRAVFRPSASGLKRVARTQDGPFRLPLASATEMRLTTAMERVALSGGKDEERDEGGKEEEGGDGMDLS